MDISRNLVRAMTALAFLLVVACGQYTMPTPPTPTPTPTPSPSVPTANVYILPGAVNLGANAFGDEPVVVHKGERMRWRNVDGVEHNVVTDTVSLPEFKATGLLAPGGEQ